MGDWGNGGAGGEYHCSCHFLGSEWLVKGRSRSSHTEHDHNNPRHPPLLVQTTSIPRLFQGLIYLTIPDRTLYNHRLQICGGNCCMTAKQQKQCRQTTNQPTSHPPTHPPTRTGTTTAALPALSVCKLCLQPFVMKGKNTTFTPAFQKDFEIAIFR